MYVCMCAFNIFLCSYMSLSLSLSLSLCVCVCVCACVAPGSRKPVYEDLRKLQARGPGGHILTACLCKPCANVSEEQA